jgi:predicted RNase H-like nuclease (RuvC/YqgF family)
MAGSTGLRYTFARHESTQPPHESSPLFERYTNDDFVELQNCRSVIDALQDRIQDLERINVDLEYRLEDQAKQCMLAEKEVTTIKREWVSKCETLQNEIDHWKNEFALEQLRSARLREQNSRTERELYRILQRKYELMRGNAGRQHSNLSYSDNVTKISSINESEKDVEEKPQVIILLNFYLFVFKMNVYIYFLFLEICSAK